MIHSHTDTAKNGASYTSADSDDGYIWHDGAEQSTIETATTYYQGSPAPAPTDDTTTYTYDPVGRLNSVYIADGRPRTVTFVTNAEGTIIRRDEADNNTSGTNSGDPHEAYYYFEGVRVGDISNNGTSDVDYAQSIAVHTTAQGTGPFRGGAATSQNLAYAEFDQSYDPINGLNQAGANSRYTVQAGDTLQSIAQALWGDSSLWYKLADVNGLDGSETLVEGRDLIVPANVSSSHNTSDTYRVYNPNDAIGDVSPTTPKPIPAPKHHDCGILGQILLVVIAVAVTIWASPASPTIWQGVLAGAAGSAASQTVGLVTGIQQKFDFAGFALSAIGGGVTAGLGAGGGIFKGGAFGGAGKVGGAALRGLAGSAITQGIGVATGLQDRFDWAGVAAAGIGAGAGALVGGGSGFGDRLARSAADGLAEATTRSLITGTDFGDNIIAVLPNVIANTVGGYIAGELEGNTPSPPRIAYADDGFYGDTTVTGGGAAPDTGAGLAAPGTGNGVADAPTVGAGGGQVGGDGDGATTGPDIVVTAPYRGDVYNGGAYDGMSAAGTHLSYIPNPYYQQRPDGSQEYGEYETPDGIVAHNHWVDYGSPQQYGSRLLAQAFGDAGNQLIDTSGQVLEGLADLVKDGITVLDLADSAGDPGAMARTDQRLTAFAAAIGSIRASDITAQNVSSPILTPMAELIQHDNVAPLVHLTAGIAVSAPFVPGATFATGGAEGAVPVWKGAGPIPGTFGVNAESLSTKGLQNFFPKRGTVEYVFDPDTSTLGVGNGQMPHTPLATSIDADTSHVVGGMFSRGPDGEMLTNEASGHFWQNWTPEVRQQFNQMMQSNGFKHIHWEGM